MENLRKANSTQYYCWKATHNCLLNYRGFAPNIEKIGTVKIFERSIEKHGLRFICSHGEAATGGVL